MLIACRKASILLSGFIVTSAVMAATGGPPKGYWILDNTDDEMPLGGLKLNLPSHFELMIYDSDCQLYPVEGSIREITKNNPKMTSQSWELKNSVDHSNTFIMTRQQKKLKLIDTEGQQLFFSETNEKSLRQEMKKHCKKHNKKANK